MPIELVDFWRRCPLDAPPYTHPEDQSVLKQVSDQSPDVTPRDFDEFLVSPRFGAFNDHRFQLSLLPVPYLGNLAKADIVVLALNPGFGFTDYYAESRVPAFRTRLVRNLKQSFDGIDFPFLGLDPEFCWHGGFLWWEQRLREVIELIAKESFGGSYRDALRDLSNRLAVIELVPYHSRAFGRSSLIKELASSREARQFVEDYLVPEAQACRKTIIVTRKAKEWPLPNEPSECIAIYRGGQTRGASLGRNTPGGKAILKRYRIAPLSR